jgi:phytoene desaturase
MYLVGAGTHPGAGVPGVLLGAEITAGLVAADHDARGQRTRQRTRRTRERAASAA